MEGELLASQAGGGGAELATDDFVEVLQVGDADFLRDSFDGKRGVHEQLSNALHTTRPNVGAHRLTAILFEETAQVRLRDADLPGEIAHPDGMGEPQLDS